MSLVTAAPDVSAPMETPAGMTWPKFRRWAMRRLIVLSVLLTMYVLSIGPMWWAWYSGMYVSTGSNYWVIAFYEPLRLACQIDCVNSVVKSYIEWWIL